MSCARVIISSLTPVSNTDTNVAFKLWFKLLLVPREDEAAMQIKRFTNHASTKTSDTFLFVYLSAT
jgi:hypothetical protein